MTKLHVLLVLHVLLGCRGGVVAGMAYGARTDRPTYAVEGGGYLRNGFGAFATMQAIGKGLDGHQTGWWLLADSRYRRVLAGDATGARLYAAVGLGVGPAAREDVVVAGHTELGVDIPAGKVGFDLSLRYRPVIEFEHLDERYWWQTVQIALTVGARR